ncbi:MAG: NAD+ synthase [Candidatus Altiarchaeota archaeon]
MDGLVLTGAELESALSEAVDSIRNIVSKTGRKGVVYGLSGGIDSALVCKLASEAGVDAHALIMPEEGLTDPECVGDAVCLAESLGVKHTILPINDILESFRRSFPHGVDKLSWGNVKARTRMVLNYLTANIEDRIVLGTGNKTELLLGYYTKYGDGGVDFLPIGSLYKTQVRQLSRHVGLPEKIICKQPSAGLWAGQTDEGELGIDYEKLDAVLLNMVDLQVSVGEASARTGVPEDKIKSLLERVKSNRHKIDGPEIPGLL